MCRGVDYGVSNGNGMCLINGGALTQAYNGVITDEFSTIESRPNGAVHPLAGVFLGRAEQHPEQFYARTGLILNRGEFARLHAANNLQLGSRIFIADVERAEGTLAIDVTSASESYRMLERIIDGDCYYTPSGSRERISIFEDDERREARCEQLIESWQRGHNDRHAQVRAPQTNVQIAAEVGRDAGKGALATTILCWAFGVGVPMAAFLWNRSRILAMFTGQGATGAAAQAAPTASWATSHLDDLQSLQGSSTAPSGSAGQAARGLAIGAGVNMLVEGLAITMAALFLQNRDIVRQENLARYGSIYDPA